MLRINTFLHNCVNQGNSIDVIQCYLEFKLLVYLPAACVIAPEINATLINECDLVVIYLFCFQLSHTVDPIHGNSYVVEHLQV